MVRENLCPVCGYEMEDQPVRYNICPSCGTEFGVHDVNTSIENLRLAWFEKGMEWWSPVDQKPKAWDPIVQLSQILAPLSIVVGKTDPDPASLPMDRYVFGSSVGIGEMLLI